MTTGERLVFVLWFILCVGTRTHGESSTCLTVYEEGGAPAVFQSPKCPRWKLPSYGSKPRYQSPAANCQTALHQGRRKQQEDRAICALDIRVPFLGKISFVSYRICIFIDLLLLTARIKFTGS